MKLKNMFQKQPQPEVVTRTDSINLDGTYFTSEGYLIDEPIVTTIGVFDYKNPDGSTRRELRLPEEVFHPESLASYQGKPIIVTHDAGMVTKDNVDEESIGTILSSGKPDGEAVRAKIIIHNTNTLEKTKYRELSLGYSLILDRTPGVWNGQPYDAIQRKIRVNHLALVRVARAGEKARLNIDGKDDEINGEGGINDLGLKDLLNRTDSDDPNKAAPQKNLIERWRGRRDFRKNHPSPGSETTPPAAEDEAKKDQPSNPVEEDKKAPETTPAPENNPPEMKQEEDKKETPSQDNHPPYLHVRGNQTTRDSGNEPATLEEALQMIAEQDQDIQTLLDFIEELVRGRDEGQGEQTQNADSIDQEKEKKEVNQNMGEEKKDIETPETTETKTQNQDNRMDAAEVDKLVTARVEALRVADRLNLDGLESKPLIDVKKAVIMKVNPEMRLDGKSEAYIDAAFDIAKEQASGINIQRKQMFGGDPKANFDGKDNECKADAARQKMVNARLGNSQA